MSRKDLKFPPSSGVFSRQAHTQVPKGLYEEELGREGFFGPASHIYHKNPPTGWTEVVGNNLPRAFYLDKVVSGDETDNWQVLLHNAQVRIGGWKLAEDMDYLARHADGDMLLFVHQGAGELLSEFGTLTLEKGDYVVLPRGTTYQVHVSEPLFFLTVENLEARYMLPDRGLLGNHALFDEGAIVPAAITKKGTHSHSTRPDEWDVLVFSGDDVTQITYPFDPVDTAGWKGDVFAWKLNVRDFRPIASHRYHVPPSAHTTLVGNGFVICTFAPRPIESDPDTLKVPFFHRNIDFDEVLFYHEGNFFSRDKVQPAMLSWHPRGIHHGPHPKALETQETRAGQMTDEVAVMIDSRYPLKAVDGLPKGAEWKDYFASWGGTKPATKATKKKLVSR